MFKVEENLQLTRLVTPDSYVIEDCKNFVPELEGFYVCLPKSRIDAIKNYMEGQPNSSFIIKTFENNLVNGLNLLLKLEKVSSYTDEFVKFYGSTQGIFDAFSAFTASESVTEKSDDALETAAQEIENIPMRDNLESTTESEEPADFVDESIFNNIQGATDTSNNEESDAENSNKMGSISQNNEAFDELLLMIRGMACKLGVIDYDDSKILTIQEVKQAQLYISKFSEATIVEAVKGALSLVETREDLVAATRFMELFAMYIQNNNLKR